MSMSFLKEKAKQDDAQKEIVMQEEHEKAVKLEVTKEQAKKTTLKERLLRQKLERLNEDLKTYNDERKPYSTSVPWKEGSKPVPLKNGLYAKGRMDASMTDAFKRFKNPDLEQIKNASPQVKEIGAGTSNLAREAFKLLQADKLKRAREDSYTLNPDTILNKRMHELLEQKEEFFNQVKESSKIDSVARKAKLEM